MIFEIKKIGMISEQTPKNKCSLVFTIKAFGDKRINARFARDKEIKLRRS